MLIPESWKLAPEKDERDDEIDRLRDELDTYKQTSPEIALAVLDAERDEITSLPGRWRWCDRPWLCDARESRTRFTH